MQNSDLQFDTEITENEDLLLVCASGEYNLIKAKNLFMLAIDNAVASDRRKILIDIVGVTGLIPFLDRFQYSETFSTYMKKHALGKVMKVAVLGNEPVVDKDRFGELVAINRGANVRVFTDRTEASNWINNKKIYQ